MTAITRPDDAPRERPPRALWFALVAPSVAFFLNLNASYFLAYWACGSRQLWVLHLLSAGTLAVCLGGGIAAWILFARAGRRWPGEGGDPGTRSRFMEVLALMASGFFSLIILAQWLGLLMLQPCGPAMRHPQAPDARLPTPVEWLG